MTRGRNTTGKRAPFLARNGDDALDTDRSMLDGVPITTGGTTLVRVMDRLRERDADPLDLPILHPAEPFLDLAGEDLRRRIVLVDDGDGVPLCLRPEFTIPVARAYLRAAREEPIKARRFACAGTVFRRGTRGSNEGLQAGIEAIGDEQREEADARAIADCVALVEGFLADTPSRAAGRLEVTLGDQAIFEALTRSLGLPNVWFRRLVRLFGDTSALERALESLVQGANSPHPASETRLGTDPALPRDVERALARGDRRSLANAISNAIAKGGMSAGVRSAEDIAARLLERRRIETTQLNQRSADLLKAVLTLDVPLTALREVLGELGALDDCGVSDKADNSDLRRALHSHERRVEALRACGLDPERLRFRGALGRPLDYYSGLVFEIAHGEVADGAGQGRTVLAGGGRYDALLSLLGAPRPVPAVGFALDMDRILSSGARQEATR